MSNPNRRLMARLMACLVMGVLGLANAPAQTVSTSTTSTTTFKQGQLALHWGDPAPVARGVKQKPYRLRAQLLTDDGRRIALPAAEARRAAGNLSALANQRVAVAFGQRRVAGSRRLERIPEVIVPVGDILGTRTPAMSAPVMSASGAVMAAAAVSGTTRWITLACKFSDITTEQKNVDFFQQQYGTGAGQLGQYWNEVSYGLINLTGSTARGWFTLPNARSNYVTTVDGKEDADLDRLFQDCVRAADATVDFTGVQGINMMFNGDLDGYAWGGYNCATYDGARRCTRVTWNPPWSFNNLAPLAHEMGHGYGLPHSNNSDGDDDTYDNPWDVMSDSWSNAVQDATFGRRPKHIAMIQRDRLGWVAPARKLVLPYGAGGVRQVELQYASTIGASGVQLIVLSMPTQSDPDRTETYTLESRRRMGNYEALLAGDAVIIHRVQGETAYSQDATTPPATVSNNEGSMFKVGETWTTPDGAYGVRVDAATANGFVVTITAASVGQPTGGDAPARRGTMPAAQTVARPATSAATDLSNASSSYRRSPATRRAPIRNPRAR